MNELNWSKEDLDPNAIWVSSVTQVTSLVPKVGTKVRDCLMNRPNFLVHL
jgi:hypothetical protein